MLRAKKCRPRGWNGCSPLSALTGSGLSMLRFTMIGSCPLLTTTASHGCSAEALISWCGASRIRHHLLWVELWVEDQWVGLPLRRGFAPLTGVPDPSRVRFVSPLRPALLLSSWFAPASRFIRRSESPASNSANLMLDEPPLIVRTRGLAGFTL